MSNAPNGILLLIIGLASLCLTTTTNHLVGIFLSRSAPSLSWMADATIPSLLASMMLYLAIRPQRPFALPAPGITWAPIIRLSTRYLAIWLGAFFLV